MMSQHHEQHPADQHQEAERPPRRGHSLRATIVATGAALGMTLAGLGVAAAQSSAPPQDGSGSSDGHVQPAPEPAPAGPGDHVEYAPAPGHREHGPGPGPGFRVGGRPVHGEMTVAKDDGTYEVVATQLGQVTAVAADSLTVRSADGYSRTYILDSETQRRGADDSENLRNGDRVHVLAVVKAGTARALRVDDAARMEERFEMRQEHRAEHREQRRAARPGADRPTA